MERFLQADLLQAGLGPTSELPTIRQLDA